MPGGHYAEESIKITVVSNESFDHDFDRCRIAVYITQIVLPSGSTAATISSIRTAGRSFAEAMDKAVSARLEDCPDHFGLITPFIEVSKTEIARIGDELGVPWVETWSCYKGSEVHCGTCGTCVERREAFPCGVHDPTEYLATLEDLETDSDLNCDHRCRI